ncbi:MAG TPA: elongation factor G [Planctomycetota bacterium]|nr:elongation factor G [Planctomycetota bacterium]
MTHATKDIRNLAIVGHGASGKTTLVERLLFEAKATTRFGRVNDGSSILDVAADERERGSSIDMHIAHAMWQGTHINMIDTPGAADFQNDAILALGAVEAALVVVDGKDGVKVNTRKLWSKCVEQELPRFIAVTRLDVAQADFDARLKQIQGAFGERCVPLYLPDPSGKAVESVFDPKSDRARSANTKLVEFAVEADEELMMRYLDGGKLTEAEVRGAFMKAVLAGRLHPVLPVSSETGLGIAALLDTIVKFFPSPKDRPPRVKKNGKVVAEVAVDGPFSGYIFKTVIGEAGRVSFVRVMSGELADGHVFKNLRDGKMEKGGHIFTVQGQAREKLEKAVAGDIIAIPKMEHIHRGDTIADEKHEAVAYETPKTPVPLSGLAVHPKKSTDAPKLLESLHKLEEEDATFKVVKDQQTGQLLVEGISNLHLQVMLNRMKTRSKVEVESERRKVPYRETIVQPARDRYRHKKQSGGAGEFAEVELEVEPNARDKGFEYIWGVVGMNVSRSFAPSIEKGIVDVMAKGVIAGYPVVDVKAKVTDGKEHPVDSKDRAFQKAGREAFKLCIKKGHPVLLEPIVKIEVHVPGDNVGDVTSDLAGGRRGHITNTEFHGDVATISANVPLAEVMEYDHQLRAMTAGEGTFSIEPSHYDVVPAAKQQAIMAEYEKHKTEEHD